MGGTHILFNAAPTYEANISVNAPMCNVYEGPWQRVCLENDVGLRFVE